MAKTEYNDWEMFGARVKHQRIMLGLTREKLSEMIDRTENYLLSLEKGDKRCSIHTIHQLSKALRISVDELLYGKQMDDKNYSNKQIIQSIIDRCDEKELEVIKNVITAIYPDFKDIVKEK